MVLPFSGAHAYERGSDGSRLLLQVFEVTSAVAQDYRQLQEVSLFLMQPTDPAAALGLYISVGGTEWQYRGFVSNSHPSGSFLVCVPRSIRTAACPLH